MPNMLPTYHFQMSPDNGDTVIALVGQYLNQIGSCVAHPFSLEFELMEVDYCLEEVVRNYKEESQVVVDRQWDSLVNSLVYRHLLQVSPGLAEEFREQVHCIPTEHLLEKLVSVLLKSYNKVRRHGEQAESVVKRQDNPLSCEVFDQSPSFKRNDGVNPEMANKSRESLGRFNFQEDQIILMEGSSMKNWGKLALLMGRKKACVQQRYERLISDVGGMKRYSHTDDYVILDEILERLDGKRLSEVSFPVKVWQNVASRLRKNWNGVIQRWRLTLLPWLLQHQAGTLNLRIEVMLATELQK